MAVGEATRRVGRVAVSSLAGGTPRTYAASAPPTTTRRWTLPLAEVSRALGGDARRMGRCPVHDDRKLSLSLGTGVDGRPLVNCFAGCDGRDVLDELERRGLIERAGNGAPPPRPRRRAEPQPAGDGPSAADQRAKAHRIWNRTRAITADDPAGRYLVARACGLPLPGADLRWLPPNPPKLPRATMVGRVTAFDDPDELVTLHFTPIDPDGTRGERRLMAGLPSVGAVRLCDDGEAVVGLFVAEGIETALSGPQPALACLNAGNLAKLPVLAGCECLTVHVDADDAGRRAADTCARRWHAAGAVARLWEPGGAHGA